MSGKLKTKPKSKSKSILAPKPVAPRPKSASAISSTRVAPAPATEEPVTKTAEESPNASPIKKKKRKRVKAQGRTQGGKKGVFAAANKIKTLTQELIRLRQERKKLYPSYEPSNSHQPVKRQQSPPRPRMEVDMDVVHVASAHSPYLVRPEFGYTNKILKTNVELRQTVGANAGKKLRDVEGLPYDIESSKEVYDKEVVQFRAKYRSCLPSERVQSTKPAVSETRGPIFIPQYHNKAPKLSAKPATVKNIVLFDPKRPFSAPPARTRASTQANSDRSLSPSKNTLYGTCTTRGGGDDATSGDYESEERVEGGYSQDFCEEDDEGVVQHGQEQKQEEEQGGSPKQQGEALALTLEDYEQYLQELNQDLFTPNSTRRPREPRTPPATTQASFFQRSLMSMGASFSASKITPGRPSSSPSMRQAQKQHTDLKYRQNQSPKTNRRGSSPLVLAGTCGLDGERQWPGMSAQFRASQVRGGPNQFRTDKTLMKAFQAFVTTFSPGKVDDTATFNDEFGVFGSGEEKGEDEEENEEVEGDWKDFLLSDTIPTKQQAQQPAVTSPGGDVKGVTKDDPVKWRMGDKVEAWFARKAKYYPGVVRRVHRKSDEFDIDYDDGDSETCVPLDYLRKRPVVHATSKKSHKAPPSPNQTPQTGTVDEGNEGFAVGDLVSANYLDEGKWFTGMISRVVVLPGDVTPAPSSGGVEGARLDRSLWYDVEYDDGDKEYGLPSCRVKIPEDTPGGEVGVRVSPAKDDVKESPQPKTPPSLKKKKSSVKFKLGANAANAANGIVRSDLYEAKTEDDDLPTNAFRCSPKRDSSQAMEMGTSQRIQEIRDQLNKSFPNSAMKMDLGGHEESDDNYLAEKGRNVHLDLVTDAALTPEQRFSQQKHLMNELRADAMREKEIRSKEEEAARRCHGDMQTSELESVMGMMDQLADKDKQEEVRREQLKQNAHETEGSKQQQSEDVPETVEESWHVSETELHKKAQLSENNAEQKHCQVTESVEQRSELTQEGSAQPSGQLADASEQQSLDLPAHTGLQRSTTDDSRICYQDDFEDGSAVSRGIKANISQVSTGGSALSYGDDFEQGSSRASSNVKHDEGGVFPLDNKNRLSTVKGSGSGDEKASGNSENYYTGKKLPVIDSKTVGSIEHNKGSARRSPIVNEVQSEASLATSYGQDFEDVSVLQEESVSSRKKTDSSSRRENHHVMKNKSMDEVSYADDFDHQASKELREGKSKEKQPPREVSVVGSDEDDYGDDFDDGSDKKMSGSQLEPAQQQSIASGGGQVASALSAGMSGDDYGDDFDDGSGDNDVDEYADEDFD